MDNQDKANIFKFTTIHKGKQLLEDKIESKECLTVGFYNKEDGVITDKTIIFFKLFDQINHLGYRIQLSNDCEKFTKKHRKLNNAFYGMNTDPNIIVIDEIDIKKYQNNTSDIIISLPTPQITLGNTLYNIDQSIKRLENSQLSNLSEIFTSTSKLSTNLRVENLLNEKIYLEMIKILYKEKSDELIQKFFNTQYKNFKVSVIISVYNGMDFLPEAINSLLEQSYRNIEIIISDDGSWDGTKEYCASLIKKTQMIPIKYIFHKNMGIGGSRNIGIKNSSGDFITLLDQDDYMLKNGIWDRVNLFKKNPDFNIVYARRDTLINNGYKRIYEHRYEPYHNDGFTSLKNGKEQLNYLLKKEVTFGFNTCLIRKEVFDKVGLFHEDRTIMGLEHNLLLMKIFENYFANYLDKAVYLLRRNHSDNHFSKSLENNTLRHTMFQKVKDLYYYQSSTT